MKQNTTERGRVRVVFRAGQNQEVTRRRGARERTIYRVEAVRSGVDTTLECPPAAVRAARNEPDRARKKNIGPWLAFTEDWFRRHQRVLLWLLNTPIVSLWFRWVLRILSCDCSRSTPILEIAPNRFTVAGQSPGQRTTVFRAHPKYAKRLYFAFRPLWWLLHAWDWAVADRWVPELSFGFATLTAYPDPNPELATVDGYVYRHNGSGESFAQMRNGSGVGAGGSDTNYVFAQVRTTYIPEFLYYRIYRGFLLFDTSALGNVNILSAVLSVFGSNKDEGFQGPTSVDIVASSPASNTSLSSGDYQAIGSTLFSSIDLATYAVSAYNDFALNAAGIANIAKTGISKFGARIAWDRLNTEPTWVGPSTTSASIYFADDTGTTRDPKLTVTYEIPITYLNRADAGSLSASEGRSIFGTAYRTDVGTVSATESRLLQASSSRADSGTISAVESSQAQIVFQALERADSGTISAVETCSLWIEEVIESETSDSGVVSAVEASFLDRIDALRELSVEDAGNLSAIEIRHLLGVTSRSDVGVISAVETSDLVKLYLPPPSPAKVRVAPWLKPGG